MTIVPGSTAPIANGLGDRIADCGIGNHAVGGSGRSTDPNDRIVGMWPANLPNGLVATGTNPRYWIVDWDNANGARTAYALCEPN